MWVCSQKYFDSLKHSGASRRALPRCLQTRGIFEALQQYFTIRRPDIVPAVVVDTHEIATTAVVSPGPRQLDEAEGRAQPAVTDSTPPVELLLQHTSPSTPAQPARTQPQSRKRSTPLEILRAMNSRGERFLEIEAERAAAMTKYVSTLQHSRKSKEDYEMAAREFLIELQYEKGLSAEDVELLNHAETCLFSHPSPARDRLVTVLGLLQSKKVAPDEVISDLRRRFGSQWSTAQSLTVTIHNEGEAADTTRL